jgi:acyl-CoA synthetase (AMP-forming)/AMP-acid ligase II
VNESLATLWEHIGAAIGERVAIRHQGTSWTYAEFEARAARLAGALAEAGAGPGTKVACYLYNSAAYLEVLYAAFKLRAVPVNVNYRYLADELTHLLTDSETSVVVFHSSLAARVAEVMPRLPRLRLAVQVADGPQPLIPGAAAYEELISGAPPQPWQRRSGADEILVYTGGTTGLPKGVVWTHAALFDGTAFATYNAAGKVPPETLEGAVATAVELRDEGRQTTSLPVVPLMHTTGLFVTIGTLLVAGTVVFSPSRSLDPRAVLELVQSDGVTQLVIAGNAVARPLVEELERAEAGRRPYDLSSLERIVSSGVAWSDDVKAELLKRKPIQLVEILGASEGGPFAVAVVSRLEDLPSRFMPAGGTRVFLEDDSVAEPGSGQIGVLAFTGPMPSGYHGDESRTAATYRWVHGLRYVIPGDYARVAADGSIELLGRGNAVINTGGEKVYTKEVEDVLLDTPEVVDAVVVGVPDPRWGEAVAALVVLAGDPGASSLRPEELADRVGSRLAGYKKPRHVLVVDSLRRGPNGKVELRWAKEYATTTVQGTA